MSSSQTRRRSSNACSRRRFFGLMSAAGAVLAQGDCSSLLSAEKPTQPNTLRIDTHTHFYDPTRDEGVPWPSKTDPFLYRKVLPADYKALPLPKPVHGTVVVEASPWVEDNQWILDLAANDPFIVGLVGNLPIGDRSFPDHLRRFKRNPLFRGLRVGASLMQRAIKERDVTRHIHQLVDSNLAMDLLIGPRELPLASVFARKFSKLRIVLDHVANVRINGGPPPQEWLAGIDKLSRSGNVYCKVSGLVEGTGRDRGDAPAALPFYRPVLDHVWESFGEHRLLYGSNWPVSERFASCATVQQIVEDYFALKGPDALANFFQHNSKKAYQWIHRTP